MLTQKQRDQIAVNRAKALEALKRTRESIEPVENNEDEDEKCHKQPNITTESRPPCNVCGSLLIDDSFYDSFEISVCRQCKLGVDYELITKHTANEEYLLTESKLKKLKYISKENPRHKNWSHMKLYLRGHCKAEALKQYGSEEAIQAEIKRRQMLQYEKSIKTSVFTFSSLKGSEEPEKVRVPSKSSKKSSVKSKVLAMVNHILGDENIA
jgi:DNA repair protein